MHMSRCATPGVQKRKENTIPFGNLMKSQVHLELPRTEVQMQHVTWLSIDIHCASCSCLVGCLLCEQQLLYLPTCRCMSTMQCQSKYKTQLPCYGAAADLGFQASSVLTCHVLQSCAASRHRGQSFCTTPLLPWSLLLHYSFSSSALPLLLARAAAAVFMLCPRAAVSCGLLYSLRQRIFLCCCLLLCLVLLSLRLSSL